MRRFLSFGPAFVVLLAIVAALLLVPTAIRRAQTARTIGLVEVASKRLESEDNILISVNAAVRAVSQMVEPSVVHIDVEGSLVSASSSGSGWIFDTNGHIVTNAHVVGDNRRVQVELSDGRVREGVIVGTDLDSDIAVIKIDDTESLIPSRLATGERVERGDRVFAFGSPFGFKFSMSEGIVSGLGRTARTALGSTRISNFIQTDAAVNPGNSGGPLVNVRGHVIGMNVAIATAGGFQIGPDGERGGGQGQSAGISFAIPLGTIESRVNQIIAGGPIQSGYMGVILSDRSSASGMKVRGVILGDVFEDGPAEKAGLMPDDIILMIDGSPIDDSQIFISMISAKRPGDTARLRVQRGQKTQELVVTLIDRPRLSLALQYERRLENLFGLRVLAVNGRVMVDEVRADSPAFIAGFAPGQFILGAAGNRVANADSFYRLLADGGLFRGRSVRVMVSVLEDDQASRALDFQRGASQSAPNAKDGGSVTEEAPQP